MHSLCFLQTGEVMNPVRQATPADVMAVATLFNA